jgi:hypothetical protein
MRASGLSKRCSWEHNSTGILLFIGPVTPDGKTATRSGNGLGNILEKWRMLRLVFETHVTVNGI